MSLVLTMWLISSWGLIDVHPLMQISEIPKLTSGCTEFVDSAENILEKRKMNQTLLANHSTLLDLLEIPQLMDTYISRAYFSGSSVTWYFILSSTYSLKFLKEWLDIIFMQLCEKWKLWWSSWLGSICCKAYYNASKVSFFHDSLSSMQPYFICKPALLRHCFLFLFQKEFLWFRL